MKRVLPLLASLLLALPALASSKPPEASSAASPFDLCRDGKVAGGKVDPVDGLRAWTCGNFEWSALVGGITDDGDATTYTDEVARYGNPTTVGGNSWILDCTGDATANNGTGDDPYVCLEAGEKIRMYSTADGLLAVDNTKPGGSIYYPSGLYHFRGCGRDEDGNANRCPVLKRWPGQVIRKMGTWGGRKIVGESLDMDGPEKGTPLRSGTYFISDHGSYGITTCGDANNENCGADPDGSTRTFHHWAFRAGLNPNHQHVCNRGPNDRECLIEVPGQSSSTEGHPPISRWGRSAVLAGTTNWNGTTDAAYSLCIDDAIATTGTCSGDRSVVCTTDSGARLTSSTGSCRFDTNGNGIYGEGTVGDNLKENLGTCEGFATAIATDAALGDGDGLLVALTTGGIGDAFDDSDNATDSSQVFLGLAQRATTSCGSGGTLVEFSDPDDLVGRWPYGFGEVTASLATKGVHVVDSPEFITQNAGFYGLNFMPAQWLGRDSAVDAADCLVAESTDEACDEIELIALGGGLGGVAEGNTFWNATGGAGAAFSSVLDGDPSGIWSRFEKNYVRNGNSLAIDAASFLVRDNIWMDWDGETTAMFAVNFNPGSVFSGNHIIASNANQIFIIQNAMGGLITGNYYNGIGTGIGGVYRLHQAHGLTIRDETISGLEGRVVVFDSIVTDEDTDGVLIDGIEVRGANMNRGGASSNLTAAITHQDYNGALDGGRWRGITVKNVNIAFDATNMDICGISLEGGTGADDTAANGQGRTLDEYRNQFHFEDIRLSTASGSGGSVEAFCLSNAAVSTNEANERIGDIWDSVGGMPSWRGIMVNGARFPDNPWASQAAADVGDCDDLAQGTVVRIHDDITAEGTCDHTTGVLTGGGAFTSVCKCAAAGTWSAL